MRFGAPQVRGVVEETKDLTRNAADRVKEDWQRTKEGTQVRPYVILILMLIYYIIPISSFHSNNLLHRTCSLTRWLCDGVCW